MDVNTCNSPAVNLFFILISYYHNDAITCSGLGPCFLRIWVVPGSDHVSPNLFT